MNNVALLDATAQAELVRAKQVKPSELVESAIGRIERINPQINAVVTPMYDDALRAASAPLQDLPFSGVPFLLKDLTVAHAGARLTEGSRFLEDYVPTEDNELARRFRQAGLIVIGKTNTPEFGLVPTTEPAIFGPTRNPWDPTRTPGGSSGGSAAAVAAGFVAAAHGNDGGGSIRIPASCCGLFGLKTTRARNPGRAFNVLSQDHVITRSVRDSAGLLDATSGPASGDPYWSPQPTRSFLQEVGADPGPLRIAFTLQTPSGAPLHADCLAAVEDALSLLSDLGHEVVEAFPPVQGESIGPAFTTVWAAACAARINGWGRITGRMPAREMFEPLTWALYQQGQATTAPAYFAALEACDRVSRDIAGFHADFDMILTSTAGEPPPLLGTFDATPEEPLRGFARAGLFVPYTPLANITGQPAMSVPLYWNEAGLPIGVHFIGRFGDEATLIRLAAQLEEARPWAQRHPPVSAV